MVIPLITVFTLWSFPHGVFSDRTDSYMVIPSISKFYFDFFQEESISREFWRSCLTSSCVKVLFVLPGFAPAGEALLFRQKDPKSMTPCLVLRNKRYASLGRRTNSLRSNKVRQQMRWSLSWARQQASEVADEHFSDMTEKARSQIFFDLCPQLFLKLLKYFNFQLVASEVPSPLRGLFRRGMNG